MKIELVRRSLHSAPLHFDELQVQCINHFKDGKNRTPLIISGGPGSGKTALLIESAISRIAAGQKPESILILTFGRERAAEIRDAIAIRSQSTISEPLARTFHSLAFSILRRKAGEDFREPILLSGPEQENYIRQLLEGDIEDGYTYWPRDLQFTDEDRLTGAKKDAPLLTQGFIRELRDLIMRANERGMSPQQLALHGKKVGEKYWESAAKFWDRYLENMALRETPGDAKMRIDPSELINLAISHLTKNADLLQQLREEYTTIIVDEFHETDPAQRSLLELLAGEDLLIAVDPDSAVGRFRGADPDHARTALDIYRQRGTEIQLINIYRNRAELANLGSTIAKKFSGINPSRSRKVVNKKSSTSLEPLIVSRLKSQSEEAQYIAYLFKRAHLISGIAYSEMAVLLRGGGTQASAIRRAFAHVGIPVSGDIEALAHNVAIAPFLLVARVAIGDQPLNYDTCEKLLLAEFGGMDSISLRRTRMALITANKDEKDKRTGSQRIIDAIDKGDIPIEDNAPLRRIFELLERARVIAKKKTTTAEDLLWSIWDNARNSDNEKIADSWKKIALRGGSRGAAADRDLDAVIQLFDSAERFTERFPGSHPRQFLDEITRESIAGDIITSQGVRPDVVEVLTVHSAKGRQWQIVALAGLQEGLWPNMRQRSSLLGSERLVERVRHGDLPRAALDELITHSLTEDERRLLHVAVTRASEQLIATAISRDEDEPSIYFEEIYEFWSSLHPEIALDSKKSQVFTEVPRPLTTASLTADLRRELLGPHAVKAAAILKTLATSGISSASPQEWIGFTESSSDAPVIGDSEVIPLSPSGADAFIECGLKWFLEKNGGRDGDSTPQILGTTIHQFAEMKVSNPSITVEEMIENITASWSMIDQSPMWVSRNNLTRAIKMLRRFADYHAAQARKVEGAELDFHFNLGRVLVKGKLDRLEVDADGKYFVIDFKTGKTEYSNNDAAESLQLACYQLAVILEGFDKKLQNNLSAGAAIVNLGSKNKDSTIRLQPPVNSDEMQEVLIEIGEGMAAKTFTARRNERCKDCGVSFCCPLQSQGRTVIS